VPLHWAVLAAPVKPAAGAPPEANRRRSRDFWGLLKAHTRQFDTHNLKIKCNANALLSVKRPCYVRLTTLRLCACTWGLRYLYINNTLTIKYSRWYANNTCTHPCSVLTVAGGIHRIHRWRGCHQRDSNAQPFASDRAQRRKAGGSSLAAITQRHQHIDDVRLAAARPALHGASEPAAPVLENRLKPSTPVRGGSSSAASSISTARRCWSRSSISFHLATTH
jgi:hypothetical protein